MSLLEVLSGERSWHIEPCHVMEGLSRIPDGVVSCIVTSIPYWGLRAYGTAPQVWGGDVECEHVWSAIVKSAANGMVASAMQGETLSGNSATRQPNVSAICSRCNGWRGELGSEPTIALFVQHIALVFRELRRVLHPTGTCWLNVGDSYAGSGKGPTGHNGIGDQEQRQGFINSRHNRPDRGLTAGKATVDVSLGGRSSPGTKPKDLCLIPERLSIALQDDGWWVRSRIAWCKTSAMPESVQDRPTSAWEHVWLLTRSAKYFYDAEAVRVGASRRTDGVEKYQSLWATAVGRHDAGGHTQWSDGEPVAAGANLRNVWLLGPEPFSGAHFAVFPTELVRRCIAAGSSEHGVCPECAAPWRRILEPSADTMAARARQREAERSRGPVDELAIGKSFTDGIPTPNVTAQFSTIGWQPTCTHGLEPVPSIVLDPFSGSGTTVMVARRLGRRGLGLELNPEYVAMSRQRIESDAPLWNTQPEPAVIVAESTIGLFDGLDP